MIGKTNAQQVSVDINQLVRAKYQQDIIYMSTDVTSPASSIGGNWEAINDSFLVSSDNTFTAGSNNTTSTHSHSVGGCTLTTAMMPSHSHTAAHSHPTTSGWRYITYNYSSIGNAGVGETRFTNDTSTPRTAAVNHLSTDYTSLAATAGSAPGTDSKGSGGSHNHGNTTESSHLPPYLVVNMWHKLNTNINNVSSSSTLLDVLYPIGYIYVSFNNTSPASLFGGTWVQLKDRFLLASGINTLGATGGSETHTHTTTDHTLTLAETPSHSHTINSHTHGPATSGHRFLIYNYSAVNKGVTENAARYGGDADYYMPTVNHKSTDFAGVDTTGAKSVTTNSQGGGGSHNHGDTGSGNHMPPYTTVYMWTRTA